MAARLSMPREIFESWGTAEERIIEIGEEGLKVERIEFNKGIFIYLKDHPYPQKGLPTPEAIQAINVAKHFLKVLLQWGYVLPFLGEKRVIKGFNTVAWPALEPYILKYEFLTLSAQAIFDALQDTDEQLAKIIAHVVEYDQAYRFRLQDLANETNELSGKEIRRLITINKARDYKEVSDKVSKIGTALSFLVLLPKYRKILQNIQLTKLKPDASDIYWMQQKVDYKYGGRL